MNANNKINLYFDKGGNIYFRILNKLYDINIDCNNKLFCETLDWDYNLTDKKNLDFGELKLSCHLSSLKGKVQKEIIKNINNEDSESVENKYFYENNEFEEYYDSDSSDGFEEKVKFVGNEEHINLIDIYDTDIALYDTLLYNNDNIFFKTSFEGIQPCYRLKIFDNQMISFRVLGEVEQLYKLIINDDDLTLNII